MGSQTPKHGCWEALGPIGGGAPRPKSFLESLYRPKYKYNLQISCIVYNFHRFFEPNVILLKLLLVTHRVKGKRLWWRPKHWKNFNVLVCIQVTWYYKWEFHCTYWNFKLLTHLTHPSVERPSSSLRFFVDTELTPVVLAHIHIVLLTFQFCVTFWCTDFKYWTDSKFK